MKYAHPALKKYSQNFLNQPALAQKIVGALEVTAGDNVVEIGPGPGILTRLLSEKPLRDLWAVELDPRWYELLREMGDPVRAVRADFLDWSLTEVATPEEPVKVIGNIPYHITSPILFKLRDHHSLISRAVIMMQKEVAERIVAAEGSKSYGILSVGLRTFADTRILFTIGRKNFTPAPQVDSAVVRFDFHPTVEGLDNPQLFIRLIRTVFNYRRKMLRNSLCRIIDRSIVYSLQSVPLDARPEQLSIALFKQLSNEINQLIHT